MKKQKQYILPLYVSAYLTLTLVFTADAFFLVEYLFNTNFGSVQDVFSQSMQASSAVSPILGFFVYSLLILPCWAGVYIAYRFVRSFRKQEPMTNIILWSAFTLFILFLCFPPEQFDEKLAAIQIGYLFFFLLISFFHAHEFFQNDKQSTNVF